jgi:8-oxo-dGTP pyrophosphatase MutT (NUDIX family)
MTASAKIPLRRTPPKPRQQYAALPYRMGEGVEILLITSRETGRWVIPKGWPMKGRAPSEAAAREAFEEAGVVGEIAQTPFGSYPYVKFLKSGLGKPCKVKVFPLKVTQQREAWPEQHQRTARWFGWADAAGAVQELRLGRIIKKFGKRASRGVTS